MSRRRYHFANLGNHTPADGLINQAGRTVTLAVQRMCCMLNSGKGNFEKTEEHLKRAAGLSLSGETIRKIVEANGRKALEMAQAGVLKPVWKANDLQQDTPAAVPAPGVQTPAVAAPNRAAVDVGKASTPQAVPGQKSKPTGPDPTLIVPVKKTPPPPQKPVYAGVDGFMVPTITDAEKRTRRKNINKKRRSMARKNPELPKPPPLPPMKAGADGPYKECKIDNFYDQDKKHRQVSVTMGNHDALGEILGRDAERLGFLLAKLRVGVGVVDGGVWIALEFIRQGLALTVLILDFFHFAEHVHAATRAVFGVAASAARGEDHDDRNQRLENQETTTGKAQAQRLKTLAKEQGYAALFNEIQEWRGRTRNPAHKKAIDALANYVAKREDSMDYPTYIANGWDIGSGPTESMCKLIPARVKGCGQRFDVDHAEEIMALEALGHSGQTERFWQLQAVSNN